MSVFIYFKRLKDYKWDINEYDDNLCDNVFKIDGKKTLNIRIIMVCLKRYHILNNDIVGLLGFGWSMS